MFTNVLWSPFSDAVCCILIRSMQARRFVAKSLVIGHYNFNGAAIVAIPIQKIDAKQKQYSIYKQIDVPDTIFAYQIIRLNELVWLFLDTI